MKKALIGLLSIILLLTCIPLGTVAVNAAYDANVVTKLALSKVGTNFANGYCLRFVKEMFTSAYGFTSTACCAYKYGSQYIDSTSRTDIPLGASVFFAGSSSTCSTCKNKCGHIGIYVGNNYVVHGWNGKIEKYTIDRIVQAGYPYRGWGWHGNIALDSAPHNHYHDKYVYYEEAHPHYKCYQCSCGEVKPNYSTSVYVNTCKICNPTNTFVYDGNAAVNFAKSHCASDAKKYPNSSSSCTDNWLCARFVANCLLAGGFPKELSSVAGLGGFAGQITEYGTKVSSSKTGAGYVKLSTFKGTLEKGDPICILYNKGTGSGSGHIVLYSGQTASDGTLLVYAHNSRKQNEKLYADSKTIEIFAVNLPRKTSDTSITSGTYCIKNNSRNQYLNVAYSEDKNAANITVGNFGNWDAQYYEITPSTTTSGYALRPLCSKTRMVNIYADTVTSGKNVCIWDNTGHDSQRWKFEKVTGGYVIRNVQAPNCVLDVEGNGNVYVSTYTGAATQIWSIQNVITYNANGGSNAPKQQFKNYDTSLKLSSSIPTRSGYTFLGWAESSSATSAKYKAGATYTAKKNITLYAVWKKQNKVKITVQPKTVYTQKNKIAKTVIKATGDGLRYEWYIKNAGQTKYHKSAVTGATYSAKMTTQSKNRRVLCYVYDKYGNRVQSNTVLLREAVSITKQPASITVKKNSIAKTTIKASGDGLKYVWYIKNAGQTKYHKSSVTRATYSVEMTAKASGRRLICYVYDKYGNKVKTKTVVIKMK